MAVVVGWFMCHVGSCWFIGTCKFNRWMFGGFSCRYAGPTTPETPCSNPDQCQISTFGSSASVWSSSSGDAVQALKINICGSRNESPSH